MDMGCIYFDQKKRAAGRGYGYVAVSRFKSREGCFLYGKLRQTDFLPVGEGTDTEVLERGIYSETSDSEEQGIEGIGAGEGVSVDDYVFQPNADFDDISANEDELADDMVFSSAKVDFEDAGTSQGISVDETVFTTSNADFLDNDANGGLKFHYHR